MMQKLQKFGAAMFVPVLLFSFAGIVVALTSLFNNPLIFGSLANTNTFWYGLWDTVQQGGWTVFNQVDMLFVVGLPIGLAKKGPRAGSHGSHRYLLDFQLLYRWFPDPLGCLLRP
jgi:PTS system arbutin-like IIC component